ncbi:MAG: hypothetical protein J2P19_18125, partial [Pseudonocardia sp.]|nr:hypothetical protein [Pseudonocardia sp.]
GTPTGVEPHERDERGGERPAAEWDDIASADDAFDNRPVEEPDEDWQVDENIAGGWQDFVEPDDDEPAEAEGAVAEADAEDEFGWPDFADDEDESDGAVAPSADAADPEVDADDGSWPGWDDERRTSRKAFTG